MVVPTNFFCISTENTLHQPRPHGRLNGLIVAASSYLSDSDTHDPRQICRMFVLRYCPAPSRLLSEGSTSPNPCGCGRCLSCIPHFDLILCTILYGNWALTSGLVILARDFFLSIRLLIVYACSVKSNSLLPIHGFRRARSALIKIHP